MTTLNNNRALSEIIEIINKSVVTEPRLKIILTNTFKKIFTNLHRFTDSIYKPWDDVLASLSQHLTNSSDECFVRCVQLTISFIDSIQRHFKNQLVFKMRYQFLHLIINQPLFSDMTVQLALFPIVSKSIQSELYIQSHEKSELFVLWMKKIADAQRQKSLSNDLIEAINDYIPNQCLQNCLWNHRERDRVLKLFELIKTPLNILYQSELPIETIGEQTIFSETIYVPAINWPLKIATDFNALPNDTQNLWREVWQHATTATTAQPSVAWLKQAIPLAESLKPSFSPQLNQWLTTILADVPRKDAPLSQKNAQLVRGLLWFAGLGGVKYFTKLLSSYVKFFYHKVAGLGPRSTIVANAALYSLGQQGVSGVIQLSKLRDEVTYATGQKAIENALTEAAKKAGIDKHNLEEVAVPDFGFDNVGHTKISIGNYELNITLVGEKTVDTCWLNGEKLLKSAPSTLKTTHPTEFKYLKEQLDEIKDVLIGQNKRLEQFYLNQRVWDYSTWRARLIDHPILGWFGRRLIWTFQQSNQIWHGLWLDGKFVNAVGEALPEMNATTQVHLWHPTESDVAEVKNWRDYLLLKQIMQPFKQAFREIYLLTPAEEQTKTYSRRFYQQFLAQKPFADLCLQAGWSYRLQSEWHHQPYATRFSEAFGIGIKLGNSISDYDLEKGMMEVYEYIMLNNVRFYDAKDNEVALKDVPVIVFSEFMRDVDQFVGKCSIGINAPQPDERTERYEDFGVWNYRQYLTESSLSASAVIRKHALDAIISKLKIAPLCTFDDKYLMVKGQLKTYKIHLGSSNILMLPNDLYLCIVPDIKQQEKATQNLFLPFEGDDMLSLILSKALLLANDHLIKDKSILQQITQNS